MRILVTGSNGFLGRNLVLRLSEQGHDVACYTRQDRPEDLPLFLQNAEAIFHLAGVNRPQQMEEFESINLGLTSQIAEIIEASDHAPIVIFASSTHAAIDSPYGRSKRAAEDRLQEMTATVRVAVHVFRLPGVFGKWGRPDYNSVVNTFCYNAANGRPLRVDDPDRSLRLVYVDDVVDAFVAALDASEPGMHWREAGPCYDVTLGDLESHITAFGDCRTTLMSERVGSGLTRALYSTYVSYLPPDRFRYRLKSHDDPRGSFVEILRTRDSGQFSFFTANPGVTRGGHYHHSKTEKFLVLRGIALFRFRNVLTGERLEFSTDGQSPEVVETSPGWAHDITNIGADELIVMLWANETFDPEHPDTIASAV